MGTCHGNRVISKGYNDYANGRYVLGYDDAPYYTGNQCNQVVQPNFQNFYGSYGNGQAASTGAYDLTQYITAGQWYKLAFTYNGNTCKIYVNGVLKNSFVKTVAFTPNPNSLFFGRNEDVNYPYYFNGAIDEIKIYKRALSAAEVAAL